jgi:DNA-binding MarR family transcriptional regulator
MELSAPFPVSQPAISRHLKVLEGAGLISRSRRATVRLSHLEAEPLREATEWLARYQAYWDESYNRLDALLAALSGLRRTNSHQSSRGGHDEDADHGGARASIR